VSALEHFPFPPVPPADGRARVIEAVRVTEPDGRVIEAVRITEPAGAAADDGYVPERDSPAAGGPLRLVGTAPARRALPPGGGASS
jgi:hypothetical protein